FHRTHGVHRGGSFKGVDLTFGDANAFGGILFRSLETAAGDMISGPSLLVDHILRLSAVGDVGTLDRAVGTRKAWDHTEPVVLAPADAPRRDPVYQTARIGLALRESRAGDEGLRYILRPYRYLTEPRGIRKGKAHLAVALYMQGMAISEIQRL